MDRVLWLNGVRSMLGADASYLVLESFDEDATDFAKDLSVDVMTLKQLETLEKDFNVPPDQWPNRSNFNEDLAGLSVILGKFRRYFWWDWLPVWNFGAYQCGILSFRSIRAACEWACLCWPGNEKIKHPPITFDVSTLTGFPRLGTGLNDGDDFHGSTSAGLNLLPLNSFR